ncbi:MAG: mRNA surveillance protein pelota [Nanoarchaeota archaeon]|nr:mRNA surveillance protein pelota [Nanoarchaeota archaeon]MBU1622306.1 mRNA surveillance protein pelota [Nanoarchaeota archaeon]
MDLIKSDFKKGLVKLKVSELDDLWYLSQLIDPGDFVKGKTTRKIKIGDSENAKTTKKTLTLKIEAETINFSESGTSLRINGLVKEGPEDVPRDSHHTISLDEASEFTLEKVNWLSYQKQKLKEATEKKYHYLLCLFDREEALFALTKKFGYQILVKIKGEMPKKRQKESLGKDFYQEIIKALDVYNGRYEPEKIILASPAFYKEDLIKKISNPELKKNIVLANCSSTDQAALDEVIRQPELKQILKDSRTREEKELFDELLNAINKEGAVAYGWDEVNTAITAGAVSKLLLTDLFIKQKREDNHFVELDEQMKKVDALQGKIHLISSKNESGKRLNGLGGIAALLRYKL